MPRLLQYLVERARDEPGENIKEFRIATEVLGRGTDFDSRTDAVVRVTTARLRTKLDEYYANDGAADPIRLYVPKGSYRLLVLPAPAPPAATQPTARRSASRRLLMAAIAAGLAALVFAGGYLIGYRSGPLRRPAPDPELVRFWGELARSDRSLLVVYSNVPHGVTSYGRVAPVEVRDAAMIDDWHTGVGEVEATLRLANVSNSLDIDFDLKRALLVDWDEVVDANVVYLGGPGANPQVAELGESANFVFEQLIIDSSKQFVIRNRAPQAGEPEVYTASLPLEADYAVVRLTRGFRSDRWTLLLAGITTFGTGAAAELVSDPDLLRSVRLALNQSLEAPLEPFECVVKVGVKNSVPFESRVKACRHLISDAPAAP